MDAHAWKPTGSTELTASDHLRLAHNNGMLMVCTTTGAAGAAELLVDDGGDSTGVRANDVPANPHLFTHTVFYGFFAAKFGSDTVAVTGPVANDRIATVAWAVPTTA